MAIISLRAYNREIEGMIDNGQLDEAVAHCRHILATFPKHIASYRLLGKAHLEQQRISDATDIFQRVLSAIPDDFISNVGMSIIREDENNLDAAIWHMELAYEAQPANIAIQDELRRLYGRRDGVQPPKVRLTRGALARMYAKGGLFDQAIAELRAAINEDPNRPDLQLLLALMFFQTSQRVEAVDTSVTILKKMPLCLEANRILAISLPDAENSEAVKNSRQIVISMDPYYAFAEPEAITSEQVSEGAVNIERLEWKSGLQIAETPNQPNWATSLGISMDKPAEENIPDWLKAAEAPAAQSLDEKAASGVSPFIWDTQEVEKIITDTSKPEGELPDWMKDAGWKPATAESIQPTGGVVTPDEQSTPSPADGALQNADIPEWLRGIAPNDFTGAEGQQPQAEGETLSNPWLEPHQPGPTDSIIQWLEEKQPDDASTPKAQADSFSFAPDEEVPDWLKDLDIPTSSTAEESPAVPAAALSSLPSAFLQEPAIPGPAEIGTAPTQNADEPSQLAPPGQPETAATQQSSEGEQPADLAEEVPDWLKDLAVAIPAAEVIASIADKTAEETPPVVEPLVEPAAAPEQAGVMEAPPVEAVSPESVETAPVQQPEVTEEAPASHLPLVAGALLAAEMLSKPSEEPVTELPATSEALVPAEPAIPAESPALTGAATAAELAAFELPDQVEESPAGGLSPQPTDQPQVDQLIPENTEIAVTEPGSMSEADAFAWLEGLAAEQDAKEEGLVTAPGEGELEPPEWVKLDLEPMTEAPISAQVPAADEQALPAEVIPDWLKGLGEEPQGALVSESTQPFAAPEPEPTLPEQTEAEQTEVEQENLEELPAWILDMEQPAAEKDVPVPAEEELEWKLEELPDWLKEITESEAGEGTAPTQAPVTAAEIGAAAVLAGMPETGAPAEQIPPPQAPISAADIAAAGIIAGLVHTEQPTPPVETGEQVMEIPPPETPISVSAEPQPVAVVEEIVPQELELAPLEPQEAPVVPAEVVPDPADTVLSDARSALSQGQPTQAVGMYTSLIKQNSHLAEVIKDLQEAVYRYPVDVDLWVTLGDAHSHSHDLQDALNAYTKAEELAR